MKYTVISHNPLTGVTLYQCPCGHTFGDMGKYPMCRSCNGTTPAPPPPPPPPPPPKPPPERKSRAKTPPGPRHTAIDAILLAMLQLRAFRDADAVAEVITHEAWKINPQRIGMDGYEDKHPDTHRTAMEWPKLVAYGFIVKTRPKHYRLTPAGERKARKYSQALAVMNEAG